MSGSGELAFGTILNPGYVVIRIDAFGPDVSLYGTVSPRRLTRAGWWSLTAVIDPAGDFNPHDWAHQIHFIDFEYGVWNQDQSFDAGWDRLIWELGPGTTGYVWVFV